MREKRAIIYRGTPIVWAVRRDHFNAAYGRCADRSCAFRRPRAAKDDPNCLVPRRHRGDRFLRAPAGRLPTRRQTRLHERRLNEVGDAGGPSSILAAKMLENIGAPWGLDPLFCRGEGRLRRRCSCSPPTRSSMSSTARLQSRASVHRGRAAPHWLGPCADRRTDSYRSQPRGWP